MDCSVICCAFGIVHGDRFYVTSRILRSSKALPLLTSTKLFVTRGETITVDSTGKEFTKVILELRMHTRKYAYPFFSGIQDTVWPNIKWTWTENPQDAMRLKINKFIMLYLRYHMNLILISILSNFCHTYDIFTTWAHAECLAAIPQKIRNWWLYLW